MHNPDTNQPNSGHGGIWAALPLAVIAVSALLPGVILVVLLFGLLVVCASCRPLAVLMGLTLTVACAIGAIEIMSAPGMGDDASIGLLFLPWAGFGIWIAAGGLSSKKGASLRTK